MRRIGRIAAFLFAIGMLGTVFASCGGKSRAPENGEDARKRAVIGMLFLPPATEEAIERYNLVSEEKIVLRRYPHNARSATPQRRARKAVIFELSQSADAYVARAMK